MGKKELQRYSLRKSSLGAASVLLGTAVLAVGGSNASADEVATTTDSATPAEAYLVYYREERIKKSLGWLSPMEYTGSLDTPRRGPRNRPHPQLT